MRRGPRSLKQRLMASASPLAILSALAYHPAPPWADDLIVQYGGRAGGGKTFG
jgi:hypothetical protein